MQNLHKFCLFPFFLVQTSKKMFRRFIVQDDKNSIFLPALIHMNPNLIKILRERMYWPICWTKKSCILNLKDKRTFALG